MIIKLQKRFGDLVLVAICCILNPNQTVGHLEGKKEGKEEREKVCLCIGVSEQLDKLSLYSKVIKLFFQIISAQQLPKSELDKPSSIVDPQVWVEIHGVPIDNNRKKTHHVDNNGMFGLMMVAHKNM